MDDEISNLGKKLTLSSEKGNAVVIPLGLWDGETDPEGFCLVERLLSRKSFNFEALHTTLSTAFNPIRGMTVKLIEDNHLLFIFNHQIDRKRVLENAPWAYEKNLLVLNMVGEEENPMKVDLDWCDFHVHIHDLPLGKMNKEMATFIGNQIG
ncbi:UNVERIFIED_CONTAM: hypothetical protein Sradi_2955600 [Sesamum radiatum]|uniref:DUF4283 domain-containing protein n=1 Tax=Sesamum radiatum TaxID=300843 RepID=A0AAW2RZU7_SESRA